MSKSKFKLGMFNFLSNKWAVLSNNKSAKDYCKKREFTHHFLKISQSYYLKDRFKKNLFIMGSNQKAFFISQIKFLKPNNIYT